MSTDYESLRASFRPRRARVVFVGESRPAGGTFFYCGDSRLFERTREAFEAHYRRRFVVADVFLRWFKGRKCFLVDLCPEPVNNLPPKQRNACRRAGEESLARELKRLNPEALVVVMRGIADSVERAASAAGLCVPMFVLPFPAQGHDREYVHGLRQVIKRLIEMKVLSGAR